MCIENGALAISPDGGRSWQDRTPDSPTDTHTIVTHLAAPGRIYACAGDGFGRPGHAYAESRDGGASWQYPDEGLEPQYGWGLAVDPGDPDTVLVSVARSPNAAHNPTAAQAFVYRRVGNGAWQAVTDGLPGPDGSLAAVLRAPQPGVFYALSNLGVFRSDDAGASFATLELPWPPGLRSQHMQDLLLLPEG